MPEKKVANPVVAVLAAAVAKKVDEPFSTFEDDEGEMNLAEELSELLDKMPNDYVLEFCGKDLQDEIRETLDGMSKEEIKDEIKDIKKILKTKIEIGKAATTPLDKIRREDEIFKQLYDELSAPIEAKFINEYDEDGKSFKGYNAQAAINRLNEVVGLNRWSTTSYCRKEEIVGKAWAVAMEVKITIRILGQLITAQGNGAAYAKKIENAYKGARTSAFKNACKYLGIGKELYEQNIDDDIVVEVKEGLKDLPIQDAIPAEAIDLETNIQNCQNLEQLKSLEEKVKLITEKSVQKIIYDKYNAKKIALMTT